MIATPTAEFRRAHDQQAQIVEAAEQSEMDLNWTPTLRPAVTETDIFEVAAMIADSGHFEDEFGKRIKASEVIEALAIEYVDDPKKLPGYVYIAFKKWLTCTAALAKFGK